MEQDVVKKKWHNYFRNIRNKYRIRISNSRTLVISLDIMAEHNVSLEAMLRTVEYLSKKYNCIAIAGIDDVSFIIDDLESFIDTITNEKTYKTQDISSVFSQYFFEYFNNIYKEKTIYWYCTCFNIPNAKVKSYLKFKKNKISMKKILIDQGANVNLFYNGDKIDFQEYLDGNIVKTIIEERKDTEHLDLLEFDKLI